MCVKKTAGPKMRRLCQFLICLLGLGTHLVWGQSFVGTAIDKDESQAKQLAFTDLQQNMYVKVESQTHVGRSSDDPNYYRLTSKLSSNLPILGASPDCIRMLKEFQCQVELTSQSAGLYLATIEQTLNNIDEEYKGLAWASADTKFTGLSNLYQEFERLKPLILVYRLLAPDAPLPSGKLTPSQIQSELHKMQQSPESIEMLALAIAQEYKGKQRIFVKPLTTDGSLEVTPFALSLHSQLLKHLDAIDDKDYAFYQLSGRYAPDGQSLQVQTTLTTQTRENQGMIASATSHTLDSNKLGGARYLPSQLNFDLLLQQGQIHAPEFNVKLQTNHGDKDLLFSRGQSIHLLVKVSQPAYYYLVGHNRTDKTALSYLLDLNDAKGPERFVQYLGHEEVNRWVSIGEFEVHPPYGIETIQVFASERSPSKQLPNTQLDGIYYVIKGEAEAVVEKTRGLVRKRAKQKQVSNQTSEAILRFTTASRQTDT